MPHSIVSGVALAMDMISVDVPRYGTVGDGVRLTCNYELGDDSLYSVKVSAPLSLSLNQ